MIVTIDISIPVLDSNLSFWFRDKGVDAAIDFGRAEDPVSFSNGSGSAFTFIGSELVDDRYSI